MRYRVPQRPHLLKITPQHEHAIVVKDDIIAWDNPWHYHPEIEILYCKKGKGTNFVGNCIRTIEEGEVLLFGSNLPHTRQRDKEFYVLNPGEVPQSIVVQFRPDFLGPSFFSLKEFVHIRELLERGQRGLKFNGHNCSSLIDKLEAIFNIRSGSAAIILLLTLLDELTRSDDFVYLNGVNYKSIAHEESSQRINKVYLFTIEHFREPISLSDVANLTNHSPASFCRYFKARTRKSYFQYLTEVRVAYACEKLMEADWHVNEVCFKSGFNNLSHFHKQFKKIMKMTPSEYQRRGSMKMPGSI